MQLAEKQMLNASCHSIIADYVHRFMLHGLPDSALELITICMPLFEAASFRQFCTGMPR